MRFLIKVIVQITFIVGLVFDATAQVPVGQFPPLAAGQLVYVIPMDQASGLIIDTLYLPKNVTLKAGEGVTAIDWSVKTIRIEENATIDLSAPQAKPGRAADGAPPPRQASYCAVGAAGAAGAGGTPGKQGVSLNIHDIDSIDNEGSLWIRTDGGPGGDGGNGGKGQQGGGPRKNVLNKRCGAANGGAGGAAGAAGPGGATAKVVVMFKANPGTSPVTNGTAGSCGASQRPSALQGKSGVIAIWGSPGCPGNAGSAGPAGGRG
ncbi:hypothetical protein PMI15_04368 [Polaromonas sp. CF318]|uniref:hypothetical protein n=1 Tax=Polaromonas sp. CF318 TaxID=1144318 RepID=UPI00027101B8|nr:hypothetical protein [Polaromonas sp. CF318]EJL78304.1 hypothetical protein PMI15_04368 [Polaromonas sp. CF318]